MTRAGIIAAITLLCGVVGSLWVAFFTLFTGDGPLAGSPIHVPVFALLVVALLTAAVVLAVIPDRRRTR